MNEVICEDGKSNRIWSYIKSKGQEFIGVAPLKVKVSSRVTTANILNEQFQSVFTKEENANFPDKGPSPYQPVNSINVSVKGVEAT